MRFFVNREGEEILWRSGGGNSLEIRRGRRRFFKDRDGEDEAAAEIWAREIGFRVPQQNKREWG